MTREKDLSYFEASGKGMLHLATWLRFLGTVVKTWFLLAPKAVGRRGRIAENILKADFSRPCFEFALAARLANSSLTKLK